MFLAVRQRKVGLVQDEIERFYRDNPQVVEKGIDSTLNLIGESQILLDLNDAFLEYKRTNKILKHVIVQRDPSLFWAILFHQNFDLIQHLVVVRFAGETGADVGGPLREFLVLCMRKPPMLGHLVFGEPTSLAFQLNSESILLINWDNFQLIPYCCSVEEQNASIQ